MIESTVKAIAKVRVLHDKDVDPLTIVCAAQMASESKKGKILGAEFQPIQPEAKPPEKPEPEPEPEPDAPAESRGVGRDDWTFLEED